MRNQLVNYAKRNIYSGPNSNPKPNDKESFYYSALFSGVMSAMFGLTLWVEKKPEYTENEKTSRIMASGITTMTGAYSIINIIRYLKK